MSIFLDREQELGVLRSRFHGEHAEFIILYGRRRIGKSALIEHFLNSVRGIRLLAREESRHLQLKKFSSECAAFFSDEFLNKTTFTDWDSFFLYLSGRDNDRMVIAIDEFPYLVREDPALPSIIQEYWDTRLKDSNIFLLLSGSSISMMEELTMQHTSPLYGRRTGQILLQGFRFIDVLDYIGDMIRAVEFYAVFGGTPAYVVSIEKDHGIFKNIAEKILASDAPLYKDVEFVLRMELNEPRYYFSILLSIATGNNRIGLIMNDTGLNKGIITKYLSILIDLRLVRRRVPVTDTSTGRKGLYFLSDNLFMFWFRFVSPHVERLERGEGDLVLEQNIAPLFSQYVGKHFESAVEDLFIEFNRAGLFPFTFERIGGWWDREQEIDLIALNEPEHAALFCECKWQDRVDACRVLSRLREKAAGVPWHTGDRTEYFSVVARSFSKRPPEGEDHVICLDADDLTTWHRRCRKNAGQDPVDTSGR